VYPCIRNAEYYCAPAPRSNNVLDGFFIPYRINVNGALRYFVLGGSYGRVLVVILEPSGTNEMRLVTAFDAPDSKKKLYRGKLKSE